MPKNKKQTSANKALSWIRMTDSMKGMMLFVVVFASIAGGYLLFKSFAASTPTPPYRCDVPRKEIGLNSVDSCVSYAQWTFNNYFGAGLNVDGKFGTKTQDVVKFFQASKGLKVDGVIGPLTWEKLESIIHPAAFTNPNGTARMACVDTRIDGGYPTSIAWVSPHIVTSTIKNVGNVGWYSHGDTMVSTHVTTQIRSNSGWKSADKELPLVVIYPGQTVTTSVTINAKLLADNALNSIGGFARYDVNTSPTTHTDFGPGCSRSVLVN